MLYFFFVLSFLPDRLTGINNNELPVRYPKKDAIIFAVFWPNIEGGLVEKKRNEISENNNERQQETDRQGESNSH